MRSFAILIILFSLINARLIHAQSKVLINEFLIDPQPQQVELINIGSASADVSGWYIDDSGGTTYYTIPLSSVIHPNSCLVLSGDFNLNKTSADTIRLFNNSSPPTSTVFSLIDSFSYKSSSGSGVSYLRIPDGGDLWSTSAANLGQYNSTMTSCLITPTITPSVTPTPPVTPTLTPEVQLIDTVTPASMPNSYDGIYINEVMVYPKPDEKEWIEIYNDNDFDAYLVDWFIDDLENAGSTPKIFSLTISAKSYSTFNITSSIFNNGGDSVRILDQRKILKDSFEYNNSELGKTWGRISLIDDNFCQQNSSSGEPNNPCITTTTNDETVIVSAFESSISSPPPAPTPPLGKRIIIGRTINVPGGTTANDSGEILGIMTMRTPPNKLVNLLTTLIFSYSLLTLSSILFKMKFKYAKNKKIFTRSLHSS